ncbi:MAG: hypothetical protein ACC612_11465 [Methanomethylovorans sp.]|uniref:hypothetical protein n=1 Tax=Methanomethylovorans sp. TaxID=2758717 RepID=UPI003530A2E7
MFVFMFVIDGQGRARKVQRPEDLDPIPEYTRLIDDDSRIIARSICKDDVRKKLFGK